MVLDILAIGRRSSNMKKRNLILFASVGVVSMASAVVGAIAWFDSALSFKAPNVTGKSAGAYFYSGDGSAEDPFTIMHPRNLYNLAWLQDLGLFNKQKKDEEGNPMVDEEGNPVYEQFHFKLHDALKTTGLNMGGWTLPPIGTQQYPFLGEFIGNDVTVSNFTISNDFADYGNNHPATISGFSNDTVKQPEIVGIFGVVGKFENEGNYAYDNSVNTVTNFAADNFVVKSNTSKTLTGLAAGYVNGELNNVAVNNGSIVVARANAKALDGSNITDKLSDHTVVGYCTKDYKTDEHTATGSIYGVDTNTQELTVNDSGDETGAGGSIKMNQIYNRVVTIRNAGTSTGQSGGSAGTTQTTVKSVVYEKDGKTIHSSTNDEQKTYFDNYHSNDYATGNYQIFHRSNNTQYMYLAGGHYEKSTYIDDYYKHTGYLITQDDTNFMSATSREITNNMSVANSINSEANPSIVWNIFDGDSGLISTLYKNQPYYLRAVSTTNLQVTNNAANGTTFTKSTYNGKTMFRCTLSSVDYYLAFDNGAWKLLPVPVVTWEDPETHVPTPSQPRPDPDDEPNVYTEQEINNNFLSGSSQIYYIDSGTTYYLDRNNASNVTSVITRSGEKPLGYGWIVNPSGTTVNAYTYNDGSNTPRYINHNNNNNGVVVNNTSFDFTIESSDDGLKLYYEITTGEGCNSRTDKYYLKYNGSSVTIGTGDSNNVFYYKDTAQAITDYNNDISADFNALVEEWEQFDINRPAYEAEYAEEVARIEQEVKNSHKLSFVQITNDNPVVGPDYYIDNSKTKNGMVYSNDDTTYFPITVNNDGERENFKTDNSYYPKDGNTGYIIAGSTYSATNNQSQDEFRNTTNIRISSYDISNIASSYTSNSSSISTSNGTANIYTLNDQYSFVKASSANYENFNDTLPKLQAVLSENNNNGGNVLGLHFMDAQISADKTVKAKSVKLNKTTYSDYELPVNSIDFNLFKKGFINFFSGMYFGGNNAFFSLHAIMRDPETHEIIQIKEIEAVYSDGIESHSYIYKFTDGTYSKAYQYNRSGAKVTLMLGDYSESFSESYSESNNQFTLSYVDIVDNLTKSCTYKSVFNTQRITNHWIRSESGHSAGGIVNNSLTENGSATVEGNSVTTKTSIFYYEIPMNAGEFCLGSVNGGTGGYLFYLDIGTNAKKVNRTSLYHHYLFVEDVTTCPNGVGIVVATIGQTVTVNRGEGAFAAIAEDYNSTLTVVRNDDAINISAGYDDDYIIGNYKDDEVTFKSGAPPGGTDIPIVSTEVSTEVRQIEYYDFNATLQEEIRTVITRTITTTTMGEDVTQTNVVTRQQYVNSELVYDSTDPELDDATKAEFYDASTGKPVVITTLVPPDTGVNTENELVIITFTGMLSEPLTVVLDVSRVGTSTYYTANGIVVNITANEDDTITITAVKADGASESIVITQTGHYVVTITGFND